MIAGKEQNTEWAFSPDDLDKNGNVKLLKFLLGRIEQLEPKNEGQMVGICAVQSMIIETDYFGDGKSLIEIENERSTSLEYSLKLTTASEILEGYLQGQNIEEITDGQWHHIKLAMLEYGERLLKLNIMK